jgi:hypothetical protein
VDAKHKKTLRMALFLGDFEFVPEQFCIFSDGILTVVRTCPEKQLDYSNYA